MASKGFKDVPEYADSAREGSTNVVPVGEVAQPRLQGRGRATHRGGTAGRGMGSV